MLRPDFGESMFFEEPVAKDLVDKFPITLELTVLALLIATIIAVPLGLLSAIKQDTPADYIARIISITGVALPNFWVGILIVYFLVLFSLGCRRWATPTCGRIQYPTCSSLSFLR
jgi:peptide/nickel transport system permease protein